MEKDMLAIFGSGFKKTFCKRKWGDKKTWSVPIFPWWTNGDRLIHHFAQLHGVLHFFHHFGLHVGRDLFPVMVAGEAGGKGFTRFLGGFDYIRLPCDVGNHVGCYLDTLA